MSRYYDEDSDFEYRVRGRASPIYDDRPIYRTARAGELLEVRGHRAGRSRSRERRSPSPQLPQPITINNRIYNDFDDEYADAPRYAVPVPRRRSRPQSPPHRRGSGFMTREELELEQTRKELEKYKLKEQLEENERKMKEQMELDRFKEAQKKAEAAKKAKEDEERVIKEYKEKEIKDKEKAEKEKAQQDKEYKARLEADLKKSGMDELQIALVLKPPAKNENRPVYTRMPRRYLSIETLEVCHIDYALDHNPEYLLIKREVPEYEQEYLWNHTRELRERRQHNHRHDAILLIEDDKKKKKERRRSGEVEYAVVRREKKRAKSPAPLIAYFAGSKK